jgi:hypothetical protein
MHRVVNAVRCRLSRAWMRTTRLVAQRDEERGNVLAVTAMA